MYPSGPPPMVKISLDFMQEHLHQAMALHEHAIVEAIEAAVAKAIAAFDFEAEAARLATEMLSATIQESLVSAIRYGAGRAVLEAFVREKLTPPLFDTLTPSHPK